MVFHDLLAESEVVAERRKARRETEIVKGRCMSTEYQQNTRLVFKNVSIDWEILFPIVQLNKYN